MAEHLRAGLAGGAWLRSSRAWAVLSLVGALVTGGWLMVLQASQEEQMGRLLRTIREFRGARVDLAKGFLHLSLAAEGESRFERAAGVELMRKALAAFVRDRRRGEGVDVDLAIRARDFETRLEEYLRNPAPSVAERVELRSAYFELELAVDQRDYRWQADLVAETERHRRNFTGAGWASVLLLGVVCGAVLRTRAEERRAVEALRSSESRFKLIFDGIQDAAVFADAGGRIGMVNPAFTRLFGYTRDEVLGRPLEILQSEAVERVCAALPGTEGGGWEQREAQFRRKDGDEFWAERAGGWVGEGSAGAGGYLALHRDVTPRRRHEEEIGRLTRLHTTLSRVLMSLMRLRSREEIFREVCQIATDCAGFKVAWVGLRDPVTDAVEMVAESGDRFGFAKRLRVYADDRPEGRGAVGTCLREGRTMVVNDFVMDPSTEPWRVAAGQLGLEAAAALPLRVEGRTVGALTVYAGRKGYFGEREVELVEEIAGGVSLALDNLEGERRRREAERRMGTQAAVSRALAESGTLAEATPRVLRVVGEAESWRFGVYWSVDEGVEKLRAMEVWRAPGVDSSELERKTRLLLVGRGEGFAGRVWAEQRAVYREGLGSAEGDGRGEAAAAAGLHGAVGVPVLASGQVVGVMEFTGWSGRVPDTGTLEMFEGMGRQVGQLIERTRVQEELRQAQKMESLGLLAGGIAHDFNNLLAVIQGNTELGLQDAARDASVLECLRQIEQASARARNLVQQILMFSRRQTPTRQRLDLGPVVGEALRLLRATLPAGVELVWEPGSHPSPVHADAGQIQQIVMNLGANAWHALDGKPGRVTVGLEDVVLDDAGALRLAGLRAGRHVCLTVSDTGKGIEAAHLARIFDPFFTTKDPGKGTGLGLSVVHSLVQLHEGAMEVSSRAGEGAVFRVYFPAVEGPGTRGITEVAGSSRGEAGVGMDEGGVGRGRRVLLVDDEESLLRVTARLLTRMGYRVEAFQRPEEALKAFREATVGFDLALVDLNMPGMSGIEVAQELLALQPGLPVLLNSGYVSSELEMEARRVGVRQVLHKPNTIDELSVALRRGLDAVPEAS